MKIVIIGGTGLIGSKTATILRQGGHEVVAASPKTGVNSITGEGLKEAMAGTQVVIDLATRPRGKTRRCWNSSRSPAATFSRWRPQRASGTMSRSHRRVGPDARKRLFPRQGRPGAADRESRHPRTIIRATQFIEFLGGIAGVRYGWRHGRPSPGLFQPIAADDVAAITADVALAAPRRGIVEIAGPDRAPLSDIIARYLKVYGDPRTVVSVRGPILRRPRRRALARAAGRGAPRPHRSRRMDPPFPDKSLIRGRRTWERGHTRRSCRPSDLG